MLDKVDVCLPKKNVNGNADYSLRKYDKWIKQFRHIERINTADALNLE